MSNMSGTNDVSTLAEQVLDRARYEYDLALYYFAIGGSGSVDRVATVGRILGNTMNEVKTDIENMRIKIREMEE